MIYPYTILTLAWDLDKDTHEYFRGFLETFINHRRITKDLNNFKDKAWPWGEQREPLSHYVYPLRNGLPNLIYRHPGALGRDGECYSHPRTGSSLSCNVLLSSLHKSKYYIAGVQGFSRCVKEAWNHESIKFEVDISSIEKYCNEIGVKIPYITNEKYFPKIHHDIHFKRSILNGTISERDARATLLKEEIIYCLSQLEDDVDFYIS